VVAQRQHQLHQTRTSRRAFRRSSTPVDSLVHQHLAA